MSAAARIGQFTVCTIIGLAALSLLTRWVVRRRALSSEVEG